ncbi:MAG: hypothetical protein M1826_005502 [Phylliscum demangeonii]|nr:MAG: hypothetical protein M1826_005502 [Phylliscum demangeonii]
MPRKKWIDKKSATTFSLVHRAQDDPQIYNDEASSMVFKEIQPKKIKTRHDLESELGSDISSIRGNEGEAALHGVFYDDTSYDYMQHMRELGKDGLEGCFVQAPSPDGKGKGKRGRKLEDALRETHLEDCIEEEREEEKADGRQIPLLSSEILPSGDSRPLNYSYQNQQDMPDALAGFQPDMDPRLREVLEALEDEAYVDDEEGVFTELGKDAREVSEQEFEWSGRGVVDGMDEMDEDGWETDDTAKPGSKRPVREADKKPSMVGGSKTAIDSEAEVKGDWMAEYGQFKQMRPHTRLSGAAAVPRSRNFESILTGSSSILTSGGRRKKRKGAMTSSIGYSMTSSSLLRTEGLTLLDDRFAKIENDYASGDDDDDDDDNDGGISLAASSALSRLSHNGPIRSDFDSMMDEFLGSHSMSGKKRVKRGGQQTGLEQLDEIRKGLGPAHLRDRKSLRT